jgi:hypothetical protein
MFVALDLPTVIPFKLNCAPRGHFMAMIWTPDELKQLVEDKSPHVHHLLWEVLKAGRVRGGDLQSKPAARAILQRMVRGRNKDELVVAEQEGPDTFYTINPEYQQLLRNLIDLNRSPVLPEPPPKRPRGRPRLSQAPAGESAPGKRSRRVGGDLHADGLELPLNDETDLAFWLDLVTILNQDSGRHIVLRTDGRSARISLG